MDIAYVNQVIFIDRYGVSTRKDFNNQIPFINGTPPKFISWDCKLWEFNIVGITAFIYKEVESFVPIS